MALVRSAGTQAWEIFLALVDTCRKLGVNFYQYILDRISQTFVLASTGYFDCAEVPTLSQLNSILSKFV